MANQATGEQTRLPDAEAIAGVSKIERYKWRSDTKPGVLQWISKHELILNAEYQRDQEGQRAKIKKIAATFSWPYFGVISVARRDPDGLLFVFDGAGRVSAALQRSDVLEVPCIIFPMNSVPEEARAFIGANTFRKPVEATQKHAAQVIAGNRASQVVDELIVRSHRKVGRFAAPGTVGCVATLTRLAASDEVRLRRLWPLIVDLCVGHPLHERIVEGLMYVDRHLAGGEFVTDARWRKRVLAVGYVELLEGANRAAAYFARGGPKVWAHGMTEALNKGRREQNRVALLG